VLRIARERGRLARAGLGVHDDESRRRGIERSFEAGSRHDVVRQCRPPQLHFEHWCPHG
jgi:hypothetical protein